MSIYLNIAVARGGPARRENERRAETDRRARPTPALSRYWLRGRRRGGRRTEEAVNIYVDRYGRAELFLVFGILLLSVLDMAFTLLHLDAGGSEANPLMAWALEWGGRGAFKVVKLASSILGLFILLLHVRFRRVRGLLTAAFVIYASILVFHLYLVYVRAA